MNGNGYLRRCIDRLASMDRKGNLCISNIRFQWNSCLKRGFLLAQYLILMVGPNPECSVEKDISHPTCHGRF